MNKTLSALIIGAIMISSPHKEASAQQYSYIQVDNSPGKCLDFDAAGATPYLQVWGCGGAAAYNQRWYWHYVMSYSGSAAYMLQNAATGTCVGVQNQSLGNAAKLVQVWCDSTDPSQHWIRLTRDANISSRSKYMNGNSGKCMDIYSTSNGTAFQQYDCATSSYWSPQMFRASLIPDGT